MPQFAFHSKVIAHNHAAANAQPRQPASAERSERESPFAAMLDSAAPAERPSQTPAKPKRDAATRSDKPDRAQASAKSDTKTEKTDKSDKAANAKSTEKDTEAETSTETGAVPETTAEAKDTEETKATDALLAAIDIQPADTTAATELKTETSQTAQVANEAITNATVTTTTVAAAPADPVAPALSNPVEPVAKAEAGSDAAAVEPALSDQIAKPETGATPDKPADKSVQPEKSKVEPTTVDDTKKSVVAVEHENAAPRHRATREDLPQPAIDAQTHGATKLSTDPVQIALPAQAAHAAPPNHLAQIQSATDVQQPNAVPIEGLAVEIASKAVAGKNRFEIRLDPPELGRIEVRLDVDRHGQVTSRLIIDRADTLDLLRRDAQTLERALQDAGLKTGDGALQFSLRDHAMSRNDDKDAGTNAAALVVPDADLPAIEATQRGYGRLLGLGSGVDIRV